MLLGKISAGFSAHARDAVLTTSLTVENALGEHEQMRELYESTL